jgi:hypothetical protein
MTGIPTWTNLTLDGLPIVVADDDFLEVLEEQSYGNTIEFTEFVEEYKKWEKENVVKKKKKQLGT